MTLQVHQIAFEDGGVVIGFIDTDDLRVGGQVLMMKQVQIDYSHPDYREDGDLLVAQALRMLRNVLEDFDDSEPHRPEVIDPDDERGMGE